MRGKHTIVINGKLYDAVSGLPVAAPDGVMRPTAAKPKPHKAFSDVGPSVAVNPKHTTAKPVHHPAATVHRTAQKSQTLRRESLKRPAPTHVESVRRKPAVGHVAKSNMISKFAPHPQPRESAQSAPAKHVAAAPHSPASQVAKPATKSMSSRERKEKLIADRLAKIDHKRSDNNSSHTRRGLFSGHPRVSTVVVACFTLVLLGGYLTYLNMPNLSVRVAATQSGVAASFPQYRPDGYRFDGPIAYSPGEVVINFQSNSGSERFTIKQKTSHWDSQAVLDNYVIKKSNNQYITSSEGGLTIYTFDNKAAWVNKGIFYSIDGNAPLSSDQVLRIAASL
jgi:hypothetical protein